MKNTSSFQPVLNIISCLLLLLACSCNIGSDKTPKQVTEADRERVNTTLDEFNEAAANADFEKYFDFFAEDGVFIGTDATENWDKKSFMSWAKPHFDKKKTWHFKSMDRHIYFYHADGNLAWFDELLSTQMKICRGSGVLIKQGDNWKIQQYVLSMTIPNQYTDTVIKIKAPIEDMLIQKQSQK